MKGIGYLMRQTVIDRNGRFYTKITTSALPPCTIARQIAACTGIAWLTKASLTATVQRRNQHESVQQLGVVSGKDGLHLTANLAHPIRSEDLNAFIAAFAESLMREGIFWHVEELTTKIEVGRFPDGNPVLQFDQRLRSAQR